MSVIHTENVAKGANLEFPKCGGGGQIVYDVLTFQSLGGARAHLGGQKKPTPLNETLDVKFWWVSKSLK